MAPNHENKVLHTGRPEPEKTGQEERADLRARFTPLAQHGYAYLDSTAFALHAHGKRSVRTPLCRSSG